MVSTGELEVCVLDFITSGWEMLRDQSRDLRARDQATPQQPVKPSHHLSVTRCSRATRRGRQGQRFLKKQCGKLRHLRISFSVLRSSTALPLVPFVRRPAAVPGSLRDRVLCCATHTAGTPLHRSATDTMTGGNTLECLKPLFSHLSLQRSVPLGRLRRLPGPTMPQRLRARASTVPLHPCTFHHLLGSCHFSHLTIFSPPLLRKAWVPTAGCSSVAQDSVLTSY